MLKNLEVVEMIEIAYLKEKETLNFFPIEVKRIIENILEILDTEYGIDRDKYADDGGYVIVVEKEEDFEKIKRTAYIDCHYTIPEYVDKIVCGSGEIYTNSLIICNNDYAISLIMPMELTPENLKDYMID
jgi:hypothetical protein